MKIDFAKFGPGLMLAAAAVGVSHLVQSTRAGADFGLTFLWLIVVISALKYPAFRFAVDYTSVTGRSLVYGYTKLGRIALAWLFISFFIDMFVATAAVALVTAGLLISIFDLPWSGPTVAVGVAVLSAIILLNGHYAKAERIVKVLVLLFSVLTLIATLFALPQLGSDGRDLFASVTPSRSLLIFIIAVSGWMPLPLTGSIFLSMWTREKQISTEGGVDHRSAVQDLRFGWTLTIVLALCFVVMGAAVLFQTNRVVPASAGAFATELLSIFTSVIGSWSYPIIAVAAVAVMWSSVFALIDAVPRVATRLFDSVMARNESAKPLYSRFLAVQIIGVTLILLLLMKDFGTFIDFATSAGFIAAPAIAWFNYRAVTSEDVSPRYQPSAILKVWNAISVLSLICFALAFVVERFW